MQYGDEYAHYPYPDEYLNERNQQFLANNVVDAYGRPAHQMQQHPQQRLESDCKFHSMHALLTLYFLQYSTFFINLHSLSVMLHHQNWRINLNVLFFSRLSLWWREWSPRPLWQRRSWRLHGGTSDTDNGDYATTERTHVFRPRRRGRR